MVYSSTLFHLDRLQGHLASFAMDVRLATRVKRRGCEAVHPLQFNAKVKNGRIRPSCPILLHGEVLN
jgi:hypothetical protein